MVGNDGRRARDAEAMNEIIITDVYRRCNYGLSDGVWIAGEMREVQLSILIAFNPSAVDFNPSLCKVLNYLRMQ